MIKKGKIQNVYKKLTNKSGVFHFLFWVLVYIILFLPIYLFCDLCLENTLAFIILLKGVIFLIFIIPLFYINLNYLVPRYYYNRKYFSYAIGVSSLLLIWLVFYFILAIIGNKYPNTLIDYSHFREVNFSDYTYSFNFPCNHYRAFTPLFSIVPIENENVIMPYYMFYNTISLDPFLYILIFGTIFIEGIKKIKTDISYALLKKLFTHVLIWIFLLVLLIYIDAIKENFRNHINIPLKDFYHFGHWNKSDFWWSVCDNFELITMTYIPIIYSFLYFLLPVFYKNKRYKIFYLLSFLLLYRFSSFDQFAYLIIINLILALVYLRNTDKSKFLKVVSNEIKNRELKEIELSLLKSQLDRHFLFNNLNNLYSKVRKHSEDAPYMLLKLSDTLRYTLYDSEKDFVSLDEESDYISNYLDLQKIRAGNRLTVQFNRSKDFGNQKIAPLLFSSFIENAFKHGVDKTIGDSFVYIDMILNGKELIFRIENNRGAEIENNTKEYGGIGIINSKKRLELLYPRKYFLDIKDSEMKSYIVELKIKLS